VGCLAPGLSNTLQPLIPTLIAALLFVACLRINWTPNIVKTALLPASCWVLVFQLLIPFFAALFLAAIQLDLIWRIPLLFVLAAAPVTGSPNIVSMLGGKPETALATLIIGTTALPFTALPMLSTLNSLQVSPFILPMVARLVLTIGLAIAAAILVRKLALKGEHSHERRASLDLCAAFLLAVVVVGLMSGFHAPDVTCLTLLAMLLFACVLNIGMHLLGIAYAHGMQQRYPMSALATETSGIMSANRNVALLLTALPMATLEPHLLFLACYQVPMYLTPLVAGWCYRR